MAGSSGPTVFNNPLLLEPYIWHRADSVTKDGSDYVSAFDDLAGNGNYLIQPTSGSQPQYITSVESLNNQPAVKFDGINDEMTTISTLNMQTEKAFSIYIVTKLVTTTVDGFRLGTSTGIRYFWTNDQTRFRLRRNDLTYNTYSPSTVGNIIRTVVLGDDGDGVSDLVKIRSNMTEEINTTIDSGGIYTYASTFTIGTADVQNIWFDGYIAELFIFKRQLYDTEDKKLMQYLNNRYVQY